MPISFTIPCRVFTSIVSPTRTGRSNARINPLTRLFTTFCNPKPIPTPNAPMIMVNLSRGIPDAINARIIPSERIPIRASNRMLPPLAEWVSFCELLFAVSPNISCSDLASTFEIQIIPIKIRILKKLKCIFPSILSFIKKLAIPSKKIS